MKNLSIIFFLLFLFTSCEDTSYKYIELVQVDSIYGDLEVINKDTTFMHNINDSAAYIIAYTNFCNSLLIERYQLEHYDLKIDRLVGFKLYDKNWLDITDVVSFKGKAEKEKEIFNERFTMRLKFAINTVEIENKLNLDTLKIKELEKYFNIKKDEFSNNNEIWYRPKSAPRYINSNGLFCYFETENGVATNLRFCMQYYAEDWLFFSSVKFSIDGKAYEFTPIEVKTDSGNGGYIWEWFDEGVYGSKKDLVIALSNAKSAKMLIVGNHYNKTKEITQDQINSIKRTFRS